jgi:glycerophosphoryl diester phosphodiesterase
MSFNPSMVAALARAAPDVPRGLTTDAFEPASWPDVPAGRLAALRRMDTDAASAAFISHDHRALSTARVAEVLGAGLQILTWTIRSPAEEAAALGIAHAITFEGYLPATVGRAG